VIDQATDLNALSLEQKRALLARLLRKKAGEARQAPVSFTQQRLWLLDQIEPGNAAYHIPIALRLSGQLDLDALEKAFDEIVRRHESLRTTFDVADEGPIQVVHPPASAAIAFHEAADLTEAVFRERFLDEVRRPFDLKRGPLVRAGLFRRGPGEHVLLLVVHHIVADGWSVGVLIQEMASLYGAFAAGQPSPLDDLPIQYADYAVWQRQQLSGARLQTLLDYWKEQLAGLTTLEIQTDRPRPAVQGVAGARVALDLPTELASALDAICRNESITPFMLYLAAFQALLHRYSGQDDIAVGAPIANRNRSETEGLVGFFANTLVLRSDLTGNPTFRELLTRVRRTALAAFDHQEMPFERLVEELNPPRDPSRNPLFQVAIAMQNTPREEVGLPGLVIAREHRETETSKFDLSLSIQRARAHPRLVLEYSTDLFDAATIQRMLVHFQTLLNGIVSNLDCRLHALPLLPATERRRLLEEFNTTRVDYPSDVCLHELIERQTELTPDAPALITEGHQYTYQQLNQRSNQLAHRLRRLGVGVETRVGVCMLRSIDMVSALLAVLKAGGAYVPLDPEYPRERLGQMLEDAQLTVLLTQRHLLDNIPDHQASVLCVDEAWADLENETADNIASGATAENLAYVIFTSGSTGRPKGAMNTHRGIVNRLLWMQDEYGLTPADRVLQKTPFSFDVSVWEFFWPLLAGAQLVLARPGGHRDTEYLVQTIVNQRITTLHFVPSMLQAFLEDPGVENCASVLRRVMCSGEVLSLALQQRFFERLSGPELHNLYGPTEAAVDVTYWKCDPTYARALVPIGRPVANTRMYVLDRWGEPTPLGVAGELYIGGLQVGRGYLNRAELTAEKFVADQFSACPEARLYRTGDLARWLPDGVIEYLGRLDHQVKIRGFRVELGEIEAVLQQHAQVREAAVLVREDVPGVKRLVAYVVSADPAPGQVDLRSFLSSKLPEYMVPWSFVFLGSLPLSPNGKLDRRALPAPPLERGDQYEEPVTPAERELARVWAEVLRLDRVGTRDNFFALGGDSILAIQVVSRARRIGLSLKPRQLFQYPTVAELAAVAQTHDLAAAAVEQGSVTGVAPLTPVQRWFFEQQIVNPNHHNQALLLQERDRLDAKLLEEALRRLLRHHDALRLRFRRQADGSWRQETLTEENATGLFQAIDLSALPEPEQSAAVTAAAARAQASLDLDHGPLTRLVQFNLGKGRPGRLLWVIHHLAVDGVSWRVLLEDLQTAYKQLQSGREVMLPVKTTSFQAWGELLSRVARSAELGAEAPYWVERLTSYAAALPVDNQAGRGGPAGFVTTWLDEEDTVALLRDVPKSYRTWIDEELLAGVARALADWSGLPAVLIDLEGHGREPELLVDCEAKAADVDLSRTVGWFTTIYPVSLLLEPGGGPGQDLIAVKEQMRSVPRNGLGYGLLRFMNDGAEISQRLRDLPRASLLFNYLGQLDGALGEKSPLKLASESAGPSEDPRQALSHPLILNALVRGNRLRMAWTYDTGAYRRETVERLAEACREALRAVVTHCREPEAGSYTPSDFSLVNLTTDELAALHLPAGRDGPQVEDVYPLTPAQQGILFHALAAPGSGVYVNQLTCRIRGLEPADFARAWQRLTDRHTPLRTAFSWQESTQPVQIVFNRAMLPWTEHDWRGVPAVEQEKRWRDLLEEDRRRGFDLAQPPLIRISLARLHDDVYQFVWTHHHLVLDGWSLPLVLREVVALYAAERLGKPAPPQPKRYRDYVAWLLKQDLGKAGAFWRRTLSGFTAPTPLPVSSLAGSASGQGEQRLTLTEAKTASLEGMVRQHGLTLNTVVQLAWAVLLGRCADQTDIVFGQVVAGRPEDVPGSESMIGMFINTLPVRVNLDENQKLVACLHALLTQQAEQRQYEYAPLVRVQGWSNVPRGTPMFQTLLAFENYPVDRALKEGGPTFAVDGIRSREQVNYPVTLTAVPGPSLKLMIAYDRTKVDDPAAERILAHLQIILEAMAANPDQRLGELSLLKAAERRLVLEEWSGTHASYPLDGRIHDLIGQSARRRPDKVAVAYEAKALTYAALDIQANRLAHFLRRQGVGPDKTVGICLERSIDMVVAVLGVLKAGGAYVPLNPEHASDRLKLVLGNAEAVLTLTHRSLRAKHGDLGRPAICLDDASTRIQDELDSDPDVKVSGHSLAYILYTSGSTGEPKGVMVSHANLVNAWYAWNETYSLTEWSPTYLQLANFSFDVWPGDFVRALCSGGKLVLCPSDTLLDADKLHALIVRENVEAIEIVPAVMRNLMSHLEITGRRLDSLRLLVVGADVWRAGEHEKLKQLVGPRTRVLNSYGVTEATIDSSYFEGDVSNLPADAVVPIGRPFPNTRYYVLDKRMQPVPAGIAGELYIGGPGLARGYAGRPDLTAERFVPSPFSTEPAARLYKTGDSARWNSHGVVEFLGRIDHQVKVRGLRIELGEIEAVLARHPAVREAAVLAREDVPGDKLLVAYVAPRAPLGVTELRSFAAKSLPDYMIPSAFVFLPSLPLTTSGKLNRQALPPPDVLRPELANEFTAPRTPVEEQMAAIWADLLKLDRVGAHDNFFELGGHSLLAARAVNKMSRTFNVQVPIRALFENSTLSHLAAWIDEQKRGPNKRPTLLQRREEHSVHVPLTSTQENMYFVVKAAPNVPILNESQDARLTGELDVPALTRAINEIVRRHDGLRMSFPLDNDTVIQKIHPYKPFDLPLIDLSYLPEIEREKALRSEYHSNRWRRYDFENGPLYRFKLIRLGPKEHALLFGQHHIIFDGASQGIFARELMTLYQAFYAGQPSPLPELPFQFSDYVYWLQDYVEQQDVERLREYAKRQAANLQPLDLAIDFPRSGQAGAGGVSIPIDLTPELSQAVRKFRGQDGITPYVTLLAALDLVLHLYSGQDYIRVSTPTANRNPVETENMIGCFMKMIMINTRVGGDPTFAELVERIRNDALEAFEHQIVPFSMLKRLARDNKPGNLSRGGNAEVVFLLQNFARASDMKNRGAAAAPGANLVISPLQKGKAVLEEDVPGGREGRQQGENIGPDLVFDFNERGGVFTGTLTYRRDLFSLETAQRIRRYFLAALQGGLASPDKPVSVLPLLDDEERQWLLSRWQPLPAPARPNQWVNRLIELNAREKPNALAVAWGNERLTYSQLNRQANRLAHYLLGKGVRTGQAVGICVERSLDMVVTVLGVLKAGAAYIPIDPETSPERVFFILHDASAALLLTQSGLRKKLGGLGVSTIWLDADKLDIAAQRADVAPDVFLDGQMPAYVIYTSGTTGEPKGVAVSHDSLLNAYLGWEAEYKLRDTVRSHLQMANFAFDVFTGDFTRALCSGGKLVLCPRDYLADPEQLYALMRQEAVDAAEFVPVVMRGLMQYLRPAAVLGQYKEFKDGMLKILSRGREMSYPVSADGKVKTKKNGEVPLTKVLKRLKTGDERSFIVEAGEVTSIGQKTGGASKKLDFMRLLVVGSDAWFVGEHKSLQELCGPETRVINSYGLTETTIDSSYFEGDAVGLRPRSITPIGRPFPNTKMYVLDERLRPLPIGVWGELHIGGPGVALGYLNRPELTAEKFIANCFVAEPGARLYKTGDRARWRQDGLLEFNGRLDGQVKVNGLRVETGAVELALKLHPDIRDAAVIAHKDAPDGVARLVAYVVPRAEDPALAQKLRHFLSNTKHIPRFMIPGLFVPLAALPFTANGKLDRQALPKPDPAGAFVPTEYAPPTTPLQKRLCAIIADVLGVERVGIHDDFFALGGNSMKGMQIVLRARKECDVDRLPVTSMFTAPNVAEFAELVAKIQALAIRGIFKKLQGDEVTLEVDGNEVHYKVSPTATVKSATKGEVPLIRVLKKLSEGARASFIVENGVVTNVRMETKARSRKLAEAANEIFNIKYGRSELAQQRLPLVTLNPTGTRPPFYMVHGADGGVRSFSSLANEFQALDRPVFGLQASGLYHQGVPFERLEDMAAHYSTAIRAAQPAGPYLIGGWSAGGLVALEMGQQLARQGAPALLILLDPWLPSSQMKEQMGELLAKDETAVIPLVFPAIFRRLHLTDKAFAAMSPAARLNALKAKFLGKSDVQMSDIDMAAVNSLLHTHRANLRAAIAYTPSAYPGPVLLVQSAGRKLKNAVLSGEPPASWAKLCPKMVGFNVSGGHLSMLSGENARLLAPRLGRIFDKIELDFAAGAQVAYSPEWLKSIFRETELTGSNSS
jgi:amino acid adenylation domain-containing protein/non-ribosomal peptide synthase protein (TIGR01720 family)